jgi:hypothetical protein
MQGEPVQGLLVLTVVDRPRHVGADHAVATLLGAFSFAPVLHRQPHGDIVVLWADIPEVQLADLPAAVEALCALDEVRSVAVVQPPPAPDRAAAPDNGEAVGHQP